MKASATFRTGACALAIATATMLPPPTSDAPNAPRYEPAAGGRVAGRTGRHLRGREGPRADPEPAGRHRGRPERRPPGAPDDRVRPRRQRGPFLGRPEPDRPASALLPLREERRRVDR